MEVKIMLGDRLNIANVLPAKDSYERLILRQDILDMVKVTSKEVDKYQLKTDAENGGITWTATKDVFTYDFSESQVNYVRQNLKELSDKKQLDASLISIYKIFV